MRLHLGGQFSFYIPGHPKWVDVELTQPTRLGDVLSGLGIPIAEIHLAVVNGQIVEIDETVVSTDDEVKVYPPVGGG